MGPKTLLRRFFARRRTKMPTPRNGWLAKRVHDPELWHFGRRSVAGGVGVGLFLSFIPIPIQMLLAVPIAIVFRINLPVTFTAIWATNPITFAPMFFFAFQVGCWLTGYTSPVDGVPFEPSFDGLAAVFKDIWYPLLIGCLACGLSAGAVGNIAVHWLWRLHLSYLRRKRAKLARVKRTEA